MKGCCMATSNPCTITLESEKLHFSVIVVIFLISRILYILISSWTSPAFTKNSCQSSIWFVHSSTVRFWHVLAGFDFCFPFSYNRNCPHLTLYITLQWHFLPPQCTGRNAIRSMQSLFTFLWVFHIFRLSLDLMACQLHVTLFLL